MFFSSKENSVVFVSASLRLKIKLLWGSLTLCWHIVELLSDYNIFILVEFKNMKIWNTFKVQTHFSIIMMWFIKPCCHDDMCCTKPLGPDTHRLKSFMWFLKHRILSACVIFLWLWRHQKENTCRNYLYW